MATPHANRTNSNMLFANFNQDFSCVSVGTRKGYSITNCDPFGRVFTSNDGARGIVEMLFCTSLIALVGAADQPHSSPRKLQIVNTKRQSLICELLFPSSILAVKLNRKTLVIVLEVEIYIYDISNMKLLHVIETTPNPEAICALSPSSDSSYLAYPSPVPSPSSVTPNPAAPTPSSSAPQSQSGDVILFSTRTLTLANVIRAHKAPISFLALNSAGTLLATASDKGTVIRVWSVPGAEKLYQFRRGTREARIYSINFNAVSTLLAVSSAHDTVHIFKLGSQEKGGKDSTGKLTGGKSASASGSLGKPGSQAKGDKNNAGKLTGGKSVSSSGSPYKLGNQATEDENGTEKLTADKSASPSGSLDSREGPSGFEGGYEAFIDGKKKNGLSLRGRSLHLTRNLTSSMGGYLPNTITELWEPSRDFAFLKLPTSGARCVVALSGTMPQVMVISSEGFFYSYNIDLENGGECALMKQYNLLDSIDEGGTGMVD